MDAFGLTLAAKCPPSMAITVPVINDEVFEANKRVAEAMSLGIPHRLIG